MFNKHSNDKLIWNHLSPPSALRCKKTNETIENHLLFMATLGSQGSWLPCPMENEGQGSLISPLSKTNQTNFKEFL